MRAGDRYSIPFIARRGVVATHPADPAETVLILLPILVDTTETPKPHPLGFDSCSRFNQSLVLATTFRR